MDKREKIINDYCYHSPIGDQTTPESSEKEQALQLLNLAVMSANASIARNE